MNEAGHGFADVNNDGIIDGTPSDFGTNGLNDLLETSADTLNYSIADSENSPDGNYDAYELDSDGDGCFDAFEENITDDDDDGIAGTGTPTVDSRGRSDSTSYTDPPNDWWQDATIDACNIEICNDGIDNNGNGVVNPDFVPKTGDEKIKAQNAEHALLSIVVLFAKDFGTGGSGKSKRIAGRGMTIQKCVNLFNMVMSSTEN